MAELGCRWSWDLTLRPLVWNFDCQWKEKEELEEGSCCKEPLGHRVRRIGMAQGFDLTEYGHRKGLGLNLSRCSGDCLGRCLCGEVG